MNSPLKIIFAGTPSFAATALAALLMQRFSVVAVLTQPDRPAGRGMQLTASPIKQLALAHNLPVLQPTSLRSAETQQELAGFSADVMVVAAYGLILPLALLQLPRYGCLNIHASLLPRWRGAAPIQRAILAGDDQTGVTIMQMDAGLDTGNMLLNKSCSIASHDTAQTLHEKLALLGSEAIVETLHLLEQGRLKPTPQDDDKATYATKLNKEEASIHWSDSATQVLRAVRAYNPSPIARAVLESTPIKIWKASPRYDLSGEAGVVLSIEKNGIIVACGQGALCLEVLQRQNARVLPAMEFMQGFLVRVGDRFVATT
ncbi:MAG: methionyl-tRNA formyltransferase [Candidatus Nitrotoga sp.]|nr:methionyl-tRNA formyltransferase [Candidatus Nitrotoga sp.]MBP0123382.1 methionyl-tRNA formyltransferase [Candidatus Nitrotoga sp.]MBP0126041.1 methionyl-tRNA formyltransferase [Candidatus Nitrotoga sp.]